MKIIYKRNHKNLVLSEKLYNEENITQDDITDGLKRLGLEPGMAVEVHSSLRSVGYVEGSASTGIKALMQVMAKQGVIVMPANLSGDGLPSEKLSKIHFT
jgi:aminoglycoside 3-N-acetyltransferase